MIMENILFNPYMKQFHKCVSQRKMQLSIEHQKLINKEIQIKIALRCYFSPSKFTKFQNFDKCPKLVARMFSCTLKGNVYWDKFVRR